MYLARVIQKAGRELRAVARATTPAHSELRDRAVALGVATVGLDLICALLAYLFEHGAPHTELKTYGDALFWTSTQLLTVSSQLQNPFTTAGRILDVFMEAYAISVVAALAGSVGAFLVKRAREAEVAAAKAAE